MNSPLTTHVLDTASGFPAAGLRIALEKRVGEQFVAISDARTNSDGRLDTALIQPEDWGAGVYRMRFETGEYFADQNSACFYPKVEVVFEVLHPEQHHHVPLLLSPFGYSTYRGS
jgi:5-hydroxyisourate hydrolase